MSHCLCAYFSLPPLPLPPPPAATADEDYDDLVDSVTIPAHYIGGDLLTNELTVPIRDDNLLEDAESFDVVLESRDPRVLLGVPHIQTIWIEDNDCKNFTHVLPNTQIVHVCVYTCISVHVHVCVVVLTGRVCVHSCVWNVYWSCFMC